MQSAQSVGSTFLSFLTKFATKDSRIHIFTDSDADGLPAAAILLRALRGSGYAQTTAEARQRFESPWSPSVIARLAQRDPEVLLLTDLGSRPDIILPGVPTLLLDHHRPTGTPPGATLLSAYHELAEGESAREIPTTGLMAFWCAQALAPEGAETLLWLAAISLISDLGDKAPFAELAQAKKLYGAGALRDVTALLNAPRRAAHGDSSSALQLLMVAESPKEILTSDEPVIAELRADLVAARAEVAAAMVVARKLPPRFSRAVREELGADLVAIRLESACQIHPLVAQQWRARFPKSAVFGVNTGFRAGWVHFSGRAPHGVNLIRFLQNHRPDEADEQYGNGHDQAAGGALRVPVWNHFITSLGFGPELLAPEVSEEDVGQAVQPE